MARLNNGESMHARRSISGDVVASVLGPDPLIGVSPFNGRPGNAQNETIEA